MHFRFASRLVLTMLLLMCGRVWAQEVTPEYTLAGGDELRIAVFQQPDFTSETRVSEAGTVGVPLVGSVAVGGLTLSQASSAIEKALSSGGFVAKPQVTITLLKIIGNQVSVLGQVNKPGSYPLLTAGYRLSQMLAVAGGIAQSGGSGVVVTGVRDGVPFRKEIDVEESFSSTAPPKDDLILLAGDTVFVPRALQFFIYGQVQKPGAYPWLRSISLMQALAQGGGLTPRGTDRGIKVTRKAASGENKTVKLSMSDPIQPDDIIYVGESLF